MSYDYKPRFAGEHVDPNRCKAGVWNGYRSYQCGKKPKRDGYCGTHHPDAQKKRDEQRKARWDAENAERKRLRAIEDAERKVIEAALAEVSGTETRLAVAVEKLRALRGGR